MTSRPLVILGVIIILIAVIAAAGYMINSRGNAPIGDNTVATSTDTSSTSSTTDTTTTGSTATTTLITPFASSTLSIPLPTANAMDTSSWQIYVDNSSSYSMEYPPNLVENATGGVLSLAFPKDGYFHWPLLDDAKVTVSVATTCPQIVSYQQAQTQKFTLNGLPFTRTVGFDVGAGNRYLEIAYDTISAGKCYHFYFIDHGTNGAGFYVNDSSLIKKYDSQHDKDLSAVLSAVNGMAANLHILAH